MRQGTAPRQPLPTHQAAALPFPPPAPDDLRTPILNFHLMSIDAAEAAPPADPLAAFVSAADAGPMLWACWRDGRLEVCGGTTPGRHVTSEIGRLFVAALRAHFGEVASGIAEREWHLGDQPRRLLPARTVREAVACAESALSLLQAQSQVLQFDFSAVLGGWRFRRVLEQLGLDPASLSPQRRQALDQLLAPAFLAPVPASAEALAERLRALLTAELH